MDRKAQSRHCDSRKVGHDGWDVLFGPSCEMIEGEVGEIDRGEGGIKRGWRKRGLEREREERKREID